MQLAFCVACFRSQEFGTVRYLQRIYDPHNPHGRWCFRWCWCSSSWELQAQRPLYLSQQSVLMHCLCHGFWLAGAGTGMWKCSGCGAPAKVCCALAVVWWSHPAGQPFSGLGLRLASPAVAPALPAAGTAAPATAPQSVTRPGSWMYCSRTGAHTCSCEQNFKRCCRSHIAVPCMKKAHGGLLHRCRCLQRQAA